MCLMRLMCGGFLFQDTGWKTAICPDYCPNLYEDMQTLTNLLQSDIGRDMRVHDSTFMWFIPFVQSLMDLKDLGVAYIVEVIHYLCLGIKDILNERMQQCDKISEFFLLILVSIIELHRNKKCLHLLWISSQEWVEAVVRCVKLPAIAFTQRNEKVSGHRARGSSVFLQASNSVQHACLQLIRSLLREGYQIGQHALCKQYLDKLNLLLRGNLSLGWQLNVQETQELQMCLKQVIRSMKDRALNASVPVGNNANSPALSTVAIKQKKSPRGDGCEMSVHGRDDFCPPFAVISKEGGDEDCLENPFRRRKSAWEEECRYASTSSGSQKSIEGFLVNIKKELDDSPAQEHVCPQSSSATKVCGEVQENGTSGLVADKCIMNNQCFNPSVQGLDCRRGIKLENEHEAGAITPVQLAAQTHVGSPENVCSSDVKKSSTSPSSPSKFKVDAKRLMNLKAKVQKIEWFSKVSGPAKPCDLKNCSLATSASKAEAEQPTFCTGYPCESQNRHKYQEANTVCENEISVETSSSGSCESAQEESVNSSFQSRLVPTKQVSKPPLLDCSSSLKSEPGLQEREDDNILLSGISDTLLKKVSTEEKPGSLLKSVFKTDLDMQTSDEEQPDLIDFVQYDCKGQISKTCSMDKTSASGLIPSSSEIQRDVSSPAAQTRPLLVKCESSDRLFEFSEYFKRENNSVVKKEEDFAKVVSEDNILTDSQVDRELGKLSLAAYAKSVNFPFDSSQDSSVHHNVCDIRRKVKGAVRSCNDVQSTESVCGADCQSNQVIVISDSSDEEKAAADGEETKKVDENTCSEKQPSPSSRVPESEPPSSPSSLEGCESQYFEFESEGDIFSVWQDTQAYSMDATQDYLQGHVSTPVDSSNSESSLKDRKHEWGYISDEAMEEVNLTEKQIENSSYTKVVTNSVLQESSSKGNVKDHLENFTDKDTIAKEFTVDSKLTEPRASTSDISLASKLALKKNSASPQNNVAKSKVARTIQRSPKISPVLKAAQNKKVLQTTSKNSQPGMSMPAVVPPRKVRQRPAPASTVEKLGLKKAPRKAFELSQRSLESIDQLRSHGKAAGRVGVPQKRKTKQTAPQKLSVKQNKKFLACQDRQYLRQTRPQKNVRAKDPVGSSESRNKVSKVDAKSLKQKPGSLELASLEETIENEREKKREETVCPSASGRKFRSLSVEEETRVSKMPRSLDLNRKSEGNSTKVPPVPMGSSLSSAALGGDKGEPSGEGCIVQPECEKTTSEENGCKPNEDSEDDDDVFLTQRDPVDMDLCSQEESVQDTAIASKIPEELDIAESLQQNESCTAVKCKYTGCVEDVETPGQCCGKHSATSSEGDHLFAKPSLPPPKARKPSTTKIFSSAGSSRSAAFSKDLEDGKKLPPASKSKVNAAKQAVVRLPRTRTVPTENQTSSSPCFTNVPQPHVYDNVLQPLNRQNNVSCVSTRSARQVCSSFLGARQRDDNIFVNEVLKWTYEMFASSSQFGPPCHLQSVVASVPVQFQNYNEYFNTFFPLMMLNAFETVSSYLPLGFFLSTLVNFFKRLKTG